MAELIVKTYGNALFELSKENDSIDSMEEEVKVVVEALKNNKEFLSVLSHPKISKDNKVKTIENIFKDKISTELLGLMVVIIKKDRYDFLIEIFNYYLDLIKEHRGIVTAHITSAQILAKEQKTKIKQRLVTLTNKKVEAVFTVDESLIGGVNIRIGDRIVDNSIKGNIELLARDLMKVQIA
ncbi:MAG: F0F1 ATP synthase subunit delta [Eubacteriales bacterium]